MRKLTKVCLLVLLVGIVAFFRAPSANGQTHGGTIGRSGAPTRLVNTSVPPK